jgi:hypothetical protein
MPPRVLPRSVSVECCLMPMSERVATAGAGHPLGKVVKILVRRVYHSYGDQVIEGVGDRCGVKGRDDF